MKRSPEASAFNWTDSSVPTTFVQEKWIVTPDDSMYDTCTDVDGSIFRSFKSVRAPVRARERKRKSALKRCVCSWERERERESESSKRPTWNGGERSGVAAHAKASGWLRCCCCCWWWRWRARSVASTRHHTIFFFITKSGSVSRALSCKVRQSLWNTCSTHHMHHLRSLSVCSLLFGRQGSLCSDGFLRDMASLFLDAKQPAKKLKVPISFKNSNTSKSDKIKTPFQRWKDKKPTKN